MLFNSLDFAVFLPLVFILYWSFNKNRKIQNVLILLASYTFYAFWDWRFLGLLAFSTLVDFLIGRAIHSENKQSKRKFFLWFSIIVNLGLLAFFKYHNFFLQSFIDAFSFFGMSVQGQFLYIILPLGISFYTFQTLSYTIDIYRQKLKPTNDVVAFAACVSFFPQLVAGPIERAQNLLPQFLKPREFESKNAIKGINQIVWGLFKKLVIADNCGQYVNDIFSNYTQYSSLTLILGAIYFSFQIYADFSGYSDIAIGTSRLFGFRLTINFNYPYFSQNIGEFWRKWHISLSTWFRDYLYIPLGGSYGGKNKFIRNILIVFMVSGLWHGANWTFVIWGLFNGVLLVLYSFIKRKSSKESKPINKIFSTLFTFALITFGWIFFRSISITDSFEYISRISQFNLGIDKLGIQRFAFEMLPILSLFILIEWFSRKKEFPLFSGKYLLVKTIVTIGLIIIFGSFSEMKEFIYFQF
jgi:D-alanyl-lipoteichoic acid acyltransferase DltB (MBOAT superfamily)